MMKEQFANMLSQEMDRKEFLRYVGVAVLMLAGGGVIMQALSSIGRTGKTSQTVGQAGPFPQKTTGSYGYGSSVYGGRANPV